jgi:Luciferase-like monooxygenase
MTSCPRVAAPDNFKHAAAAYSETPPVSYPGIDPNPAIRGQFPRQTHQSARKRAGMLDEALGILQAAWTGELVRHRGEHYTIDSMRFLPRPVQRPGVPIWVAGFYGNSKPLRRAIRYQGFFPVGIEHPDQLAEIHAELRRLGRDTSDVVAEPFDLAVELDPGSDPAPYAAAGATWALVAFPSNPVSLGQVRGVIRDGPPPTASSHSTAPGADPR